jgi:hypothetical protein
MAIRLGASFVRGSFSIDKAQLEPLVKSGVAAQVRGVH